MSAGAIRPCEALVHAVVSGPSGVARGSLVDRHMLPRLSFPRLLALALLVALSCASGALWLVLARGAATDAVRPREAAGRDLLDAVARAAALERARRRAGRRNAAALAEGYSASLDRVRASADALGDPTVSDIATRLGVSAGDADSELLDMLALRAGSVVLDASTAERAEASRSLERVLGSLLGMALGGVAVALVCSGAIARERRSLERVLPAGARGEGLDRRAGRLAGRASAAVQQQIGLVGERLELARVLHEAEANERRMQAEVRLNRSRIEKLEVAQMNDELTGVLNFKYFLLRLGEALDDFASAGRQFCLLALDLDDFKGINDGYGHHVGDAALKAMAALLRESVRGTDVVFRKSGDEFYVLMPDASAAEGEALGERLLTAVSEHRVVYESGGEQYSVRLGTSIGVLHCEQVDAHLLTTLSRDQLLSETYGFADAALFKAKFAGKGCARIYTTGLTVRGVNPDEFPPEFDHLHRAIRSKYPLLPEAQKTVFNRNIGACLALLTPRRRMRGHHASVGERA